MQRHLHRISSLMEATGEISMRSCGLLGWLAVVGLHAAALAQESAPMPPLRPDQAAFRALYRELVETNTSLSSGSCTVAAERMAAHLRAAGFMESELTLFATADHPKEGGLVAILAGTSKSARPMLLLGHLDVVEANRSDWTRDPFTLVEDNGYFYARGSADMKAMDAIWVDALVRFKAAGYRPKRTIKMALTCGEESNAFNGADWLSRNRPDLIAAGFALNEGGGGRTDGKGKVVVQTIQVGEKAVQDFRLEAFNAGGHSSIPIRDNAIYELADALARIRDHEFPLKLSDTTRAYFAKSGAARDDEMGRAMVALSQDPGNHAAEALVSTDRRFHSMVRTTCVATLLSAGHAHNALPQHAEANINCRILPGETVEGTLQALTAAVGDSNLKLSVVAPVRPLAVAPPLDPNIIGPAEKLVAKYFPGVPLVPAMSTGATDGVFLEAVGIPVYGVPGLWGDPDGNGVHGLNERNSVRSVFTARDFLTELIKAYAAHE
jgi:acetylornithine deacetylase/succinyl-diaminopimelate desuccinylase-like protein